MKRNFKGMKRDQMRDEIFVQDRLTSRQATGHSA